MVVCSMSHTVFELTQLTQLTQDESDAVSKIFKDEKVTVDPDSVTSLSLEKLQQMLKEEGFEELAINLKERISKGE